MKPGNEDTLEEQYAIKFCSKLGKMPQVRIECFRLFWTIYMNQASVFEWHKRLKEGRESVRENKRCRRSKEVNTPELIDQSVRVGFTILRF